MSEPIEGQYFDWLCAKVLDPKTNDYRDLLRTLYCTEFVWDPVPNDYNRAEDGIELRQDYTRTAHVSRKGDWYTSPCSVFEVLVALAMRAASQSEISVRDWFWIFIENLGLDEYRRTYDDDKHAIEEILNRFIWRTYDSRGHGGLFPMRHTQTDQRQIEIWYQLSEYLDDQGLI